MQATYWFNDVISFDGISVVPFERGELGPDDPKLFGTHSLGRTKVTLIYRQTGNLRAVQLLLGHTKIESTVRHLGIEVDDALDNGISGGLKCPGRADILCPIILASGYLGQRTSPSGSPSS
jgi:hypothetical protein